jgi:RHS repeat-associated protein
LPYTYTYDAYGRAISETGSTDNSYQFAGEQFDANLGEYYLRQRYYNQNTGRFTRRDTFEGTTGEPLTLHKYGYAHSNPVNYIDPSGLAISGTMQDFALAFGILALLATSAYVTGVYNSEPLGGFGDGPQPRFPDHTGRGRIVDRLINFGRQLGGFAEGSQPEVLRHTGRASWDAIDLARYIFDIDQQVGRHLVGPYGEGRRGGHHPHQQAARGNSANYNARAAIAVRFGTFDHGAINRVQGQLHRQFVASGGTISTYNLTVEEDFQRQAMKAGGFTDAETEQILAISRDELLRQGALDPTRVPWGP